MFKKILVVEDLDSIGFGIAQMLMQSAHNYTVEQALYCDDAYLKFQKAKQNKDPFDLLITDLSFKNDHRANKINSGDDLVQVLRSKQPNLKTVVYSVEDRPSRVKRLFNEKAIDAYVVKGRHGLKYLEEAITNLRQNKTYVSPDIANLMDKKDVFEIDEYDLKLMGHLSNGLTQEQIANLFRNKNISPSSVSSIEKRLNKLKVELRAKNTIQLIATVKDLGLL